MPSLKELRGRINSVKSTRKITSAMKMVAAAKLRRAQQEAEAGRSYAELMARIVVNLARAARDNDAAHPLLRGNGQDRTHLIVLVTADRGLAGAFNSNPSRQARNLARRLEADGKEVKLLTIGRKGGDYLRREFATDRFLDAVPSTAAKIGGFTDEAERLARAIVDSFNDGGFDRATLIYNRFVNVMTQTPQELSLIPIGVAGNDNESADENAPGPDSPYEFEPDEASVLSRLLARNIAAQIQRAVLESAAGEQGARMTAMDNATRNAGKAIDRLTLRYNQTRQANITRELIEIISGADAV